MNADLIEFRRRLLALGIRPDCSTATAEPLGILECRLTLAIETRRRLIDALHDAAKESKRLADWSKRGLG